MKVMSTYVMGKGPTKIRLQFLWCFRLKTDINIFGGNVYIFNNHKLIRSLLTARVICSSKTNAGFLIGRRSPR